MSVTDAIVKTSVGIAAMFAVIAAFVFAALFVMTYGEAVAPLLIEHTAMTDPDRAMNVGVLLTIYGLCGLPLLYSIGEGVVGDRP